MVYSFGLMVGSMKGVGRMENNTVKVITHLPQEKLNMENGKKENVFNGFHEINLPKNKHNSFNSFRSCFPAKGSNRRVFYLSN